LAGRGKYRTIHCPRCAHNSGWQETHFQSIDRRRGALLFTQSAWDWLRVAPIQGVIYASIVLTAAEIAAAEALAAEILIAQQAAAATAATAEAVQVANAAQAAQATTQAAQAAQATTQAASRPHRPLTHRHKSAVFKHWHKK
jgi:hypothetical protein